MALSASDSQLPQRGASPEQRPRKLSTSLSILLLLCWIVAIGNIWFANDDDSYEASLDAAIFGDPVREDKKNGYVERVGGEGGVINHAPDKPDSYLGGDTNETSVTDNSSSNNERREVLENDEIKTHQSELSVEALQPVTSKSCCIPAVYNRTRHPKDVDCFGTCYNERACNDPNYPFNSAEEKALFPMAEHTPESKRELRRKCTFPKKLTPPVKWCQKPHIDDRAGTAAHLVGGIPPAGCSVTKPGGGSGAFQHVILFPSAKLAFCGIPKVGITQWEQFLRFYFGAKDYPALPHYKMDRLFYQFDLLDSNAQRRIWEDDSWTWASFIRNPAERLLSAYLDKIKPKNGSLTFDDFIDSISKPLNITNQGGCTRRGVDGLSWCSDPHWRPQIYSCGMSERLDRFQFIGDLHSAAYQTRELLSHVGLWESHGKHFIHGGVQEGHDPECNFKSHPFNHTRHVGFQQKDEVNSALASETAYGHAKGSKGKMDEYFTPELLKKVQEELYPDDYNLWKLVSGNGIKLSNGKELMTKLSSKCADTIAL